MLPSFDDIVANLEFLDDWEERYRYVIELGRMMPELPEEAHSEANKVHGCASQVWLETRTRADGSDPVLDFRGDSDAHIVRGLVAILIAFYSGRPVGDVQTLDIEGYLKRLQLDEHLTQLGRVADPLGIGFLDLGMSPLWRREETPVMPKSRYRIMMGYMPKVGSLGLDMMLRTATVQVNLDFSSEADMVKKLRVSLALQPLATALFANSPFTDGRPNGFLSMRSHIWTDTDPHRTGMMPIAFEDGFGYERYVDWLLDVPMYFVKRGATYHDVAGASFRDLMAGRLAQLPGELPTTSDLANHVSTVFPEVRLKRFLEMRGSDTGPRSFLMAAPAFWVGLLYDRSSLDAAWDLVKHWTSEERQTFRDEAPTLGLDAVVAGRKAAEIARETLKIARAGLTRRAIKDALGRDETSYLDPLEQVAESGRSRARDLLDRYHGAWGESVRPAFRECVLLDPAPA